MHSEVITSKSKNAQATDISPDRKQSMKSKSVIEGTPNIKAANNLKYEAAVAPV